MNQRTLWIVALVIESCAAPSTGRDSGNEPFDVAHDADPNDARDIALDTHDANGTNDVSDGAMAMDAADIASPTADASDESIAADATDAADAAPDVPVADAGRIACGSGFATEVFRDDFDGASVDTTRWDVVQQAPGGGMFTQLTAMLRANVTVTGGVLHVASKRHCSNPYPAGAPEHPGACSGTPYYSGGWLRSATSYAPRRGLAIFVARIPAPVRGTFPGLWMRNTNGSTLYGELDLIEQWWDGATIGRASDPDTYSVTTWIQGSSTLAHTSGNTVGPYAALNGGFHVWEVEWDASVPSITYYYRDALGAPRQRVRTVDQTTSGLNGAVTRTQLAAVLALGWRPYIDFAVQPLSAYHDSPDDPPPAVDPYDPADLLVDSVIVCAP